MSEEERVGYLREKLGYEAKKKGDTPHEGASKEFKKGFGSNVTPRNFGKGGDDKRDWTCVCGNVNKAHIRYKVANREVCSACRQEREYVDTEWLGLNADSE